MDYDTDHAEIRRLAYQIWLKEGQPDGRDREHWAAAKAAWAMQRRGLHDVGGQHASAEPEMSIRKPRAKKR
jgi:hypothetical protein